jgi:hypothetical protein
MSDSSGPTATGEIGFATTNKGTSYWLVGWEDVRFPSRKDAEDFRDWLFSTDEEDE